MSSTSLLALVARCRVLCRPRPTVPDGELLARFVRQRDAAAFEELLQRYAPLVWGVCRRIAPTEAESEDAFQATFLALVRQAGRLDGRQPLGGWLHTVAVRLARKAMARTRKQTPRATLPEPVTPGDVADEVSSRELFRAVDEEIERLPALLRPPLILCCLQRRTRDEAAEELGCSVAAVKSRLERGRHLLRRRLEQRGLGLPAAFLVLGLSGGAVRASLRARALQSVLGSAPPAVAALAGAGPRILTAGKGKLLLAALLMATAAAGVIGQVLTTKPPEALAAPPQAKAAAEPKKPDAPRVRTDRHGDPLPDGAVARLGTVRWRHGFFVHALAYSPNGKMIAATGCGRAITLWDAATGKEVCQFPNRRQPNGVAFSPDSKILATIDTPFGHLWDVATGKELRQLKGHTNSMTSIVFSPDGKLVATGDHDGTVRLWDPATGTEQRRIDCGQDAASYTVAFSPDGKSLASGGKDGVIRLWDSRTGEERRRLKRHEKAILSVAFSPDGKRLASTSEDETIRLWDVATGRQSRILAEKMGGYNKPISFSPDGTLLASGCPDGTIRLWDVAEGAEKRRWQAGALAVRAVAFSPDGKTIASAAAWENIRLWDAATGRERHPSEEHRGPVHFLRFSPDGASLVSIDRDRRLLQWDLTTQKPRRQSSWTAKGFFGAVALSPDGETLAVGGWPDFEVRLWNVRTGKPGRLLGKHEKGGLWAVAFSPDGRLVASGGEDRVIHVWDVGDGKEVQQIKGIAKAVKRLCFSPDSKSLACGTETQGGRASSEPTLYLWDVASGKERFHFGNYVPLEGALVFSPDGKVLACNAGDRDAGMVRLWDTKTGKELCRHEGHREMVGAIAFSPDGKLIASGSGDLGARDNSVHIWEAATGRLIRRFEGHHSCVDSVAFSPDGLTVASGAGDSTILLWDITNRRADGRWYGKPLTPREMDTCWVALMDEDAAKAYDAVWALIASAEQAVPFLTKHLQPVPRPDAKMVSQLIADLDSDNFTVRQRAMKELSKFGDAIAPALRRALAEKPALEARRRLQQLLDQTRDWTPERLRDRRAIQALEHLGTRQAQEVLQALAHGAAGTLRTEEARAALRRERGTRPSGGRGDTAP